MMMLEEAPDPENTNSQEESSKQSCWEENSKKPHREISKQPRREKISKHSRREEISKRSHQEEIWGQPWNKEIYHSIHDGGLPDAGPSRAGRNAKTLGRGWFTQAHHPSNHLW